MLIRLFLPKQTVRSENQFAFGINYFIIILFYLELNCDETEFVIFIKKGTLILITGSYQDN